MEIELVVALLSAFVSIVLAVMANYFTRKNEKNLALLNARLDEQKAEKDAHRDYLYDARKRLYSECEPLFFLLNELSEAARYRILSLARAARDGNLPNWLDHEGYYLRSTVYFLIAPLSIYKLIQRRLTAIDLSVDHNVETTYKLIKGIDWTFTDDFGFAFTNPKLEYQPKDIGVVDIDKPEKYRKQGVPVGRLDNAIEALILGNSGTPCLMSFGEFEKQLLIEDSNVREEFLFLINLFWKFHPKTQPVLWRILVAQAHLYMALAQACNTKVGDNVDCLELVKIIPETKRKLLDWRSSQNQASDKEVLEDPFSATKLWLEKYFRNESDLS